MRNEQDQHDVMVENRTYDEISVGDQASISRTLRMEDVQLFSVLSGDVNPTVADPDLAANGIYREVIAHGMWAGTLISSILGTKLPGAGTILVDKTLKFKKPVRLGDTITVHVKCVRKSERNRIHFECFCLNQDGELAVTGTAEVMAPTQKIKSHEVHLPNVSIADKHQRYLHLLERAKGFDPIRTAVVYPCDKDSLKGPLDAAKENLIVPVLVGPGKKIRAVAQEFGLNLDGCDFVEAETPEEAAETATRLAREKDCVALMKGSLHTDTLMAAVVSKAGGLRTGRRLSHVFYMDVPTYSKPLMITDAAINIAPTMEEKADIAQNAIDLAHMLGVSEPKVAILSAVETINPKIQSTLDAAALCKMADRGQIKGGLLDGPLAFDNAVSFAAAKTKGIKSLVAGNADILLVPDLESGNMVAKQLEYLANAMSAGVVLGAKCPIVLTSRADTAETRAASCAIAAIMAHQSNAA